jgi:nitroreductase
MPFSQPITAIIRQRFSCRSYLNVPIEEGKRRALAGFAAGRRSGPLGTPLRFALVAATDEDSRALRGLGTYGFIRSPMGFIVGAMGAGEKNLEDYGYLLEEIVLYATDLGLGTCWLGGSYTRSSFARRIGAAAGEAVPAVVSTGHPADRSDIRNDPIRRRIGATSRLPWGELFFRERFGRPLSPEEAGAYAEPLEMVRLGPSASNKQPWRIVREGAAWHFYLQRTRGYPPRLGSQLLGLADLQRIDMGIAMSHFALTAAELGLAGRWLVQEPAIERPDELTEYIVSWAV